VAEVSTDKAVVEIPSMHPGKVVKLHYAEGEIAKVHSPLFAINIAGETTTEAPVQAPAHTSGVQSAAPIPTGAIDFILPDIGEGVIECEIIEWKVKEGEDIAEDQVVADVSTDKAVVEIPSMYNGRVTKLYYQQGEIAKVHSPLFAIAVDGQVNNSLTETQATVAELAPANAADSEHDGHRPTSGKVLTSPAVRRLAREHNIDLCTVAGTGKNGRIFKEDFLRHLEQGHQAAPATTHVQQPENAAIVTDTTTADRVEPIKGVRAVMAKMMAESVATIPHFTYVDEIDLSELIALRLQLKERHAPQGIKITLMPLFMKALSLALKEFPVINSRANEALTELHYLSSHNIGMAVDSKVGLLVPNVKNVQNLSIIELAKEITRLTDSARSGKVSPEDLKGGTITISNVGAIGGTAATPIINKPEVAIVALGKIQTLPRFNDHGDVIKRSIMTVSWSGDHRIIDGGTIARFNNLWSQYLQDPTSMLAAMH